MCCITVYFYITRYLFICPNIVSCFKFIYIFFLSATFFVEQQIRKHKDLYKLTYINYINKKC